MERRLRAIYRGKLLIPQEPCDFPEGAVLDLVVAGSPVVPPDVGDPAERARILARLTDRMRRNRLPANAPRLTREQLHERG